LLIFLSILYSLESRQNVPIKTSIKNLFYKNTLIKKYVVPKVHRSADGRNHEWLSTHAPHPTTGLGGGACRGRYPTYRYRTWLALCSTGRWYAWPGEERGHAVPWVTTGTDTRGGAMGAEAPLRLGLLYLKYFKT